MMRIVRFSGLIVTFEIVISYIFPGNFIEIDQVSKGLKYFFINFNCFGRFLTFF